MASTTATHEAGHAIVACGLHLKLDHARLNVTGRSAGHVQWNPFGAQPAAVAQIALILAGYVAEQVADCDDSDLESYFLVEVDPEADANRALRAAIDVYGSERRAWRALEQAWLRVDQWLRVPAHWRAVLELAAMIDAGEVDARTIYACAERHGVTIRDRRLVPRGREIFDDDFRAPKPARSSAQAR